MTVRAPPRCGKTKQRSPQPRLFSGISMRREGSRDARNRPRAEPAARRAAEPLAPRLSRSRSTPLARRAAKPRMTRPRWPRARLAARRSAQAPPSGQRSALALVRVAPLDRALQETLTRQRGLAGGRAVVLGARRAVAPRQLASRLLRHPRRRNPEDEPPLAARTGCSSGRSYAGSAAAAEKTAGASASTASTCAPHGHLCGDFAHENAHA